MTFKLVKWNKEHINSVAQHANNQKIADNLRDVFPYPYTYADAEGYVNACIKNDDDHQITRAIEVAGKAVGSIGVFVKEDVYRKSAELGYWLAEDYWGQGIMSEAVKQICTEVFECFDIVRIFAEPYGFNIGSRRGLEKAGFTLEGIMKSSVCKHEKIYDSCMYALLK